MRASVFSRRPGDSRRAAMVAAALLASLACGAAAFAQKSLSPQSTAQSLSPQSTAPPNALQGFSQNRGQPVNIQADQLVVRDKDKMATFTGNVHVTQGDTEMRSKALVVFYMDSSRPADAAKPGTAPPAMTTTSTPTGEQQSIRRIEATGGVLVTQKDQNAAGDKGIFDMQSNTVTLSGNVVVTHGKGARGDVVRSQRLVVDLTTGVSHMDGGRVDALFGSGPSGESTLPGPEPSPRSSRAN